MSVYKIIIDEDAFLDILYSTEWYENQQKGIGQKFKRQVKSQINSLKKNATLYRIRYSNVRCMIVKNFPFMVHYRINEKLKLVEIFAVTHTSRNPKIWVKNTK